MSFEFKTFNAPQKNIFVFAAHMESDLELCKIFRISSIYVRREIGTIK